MDSPRKILDENRVEFRQAGLSIVRSDIKRFAARYSHYYWFSVVRDPYSRILSNYHNKLNRFTKMFNRGVYYRGKLAQLIRGRRAWGKANWASECMQRFLSFERFVDGLHNHGVHFDSHYVPQHEVLLPGLISYDKLIRLERYQEGIRDLIEDRKVKCNAGLLGNNLPSLNASAYRKDVNGFFSEETKEIVYDLYRRDFELLGYTR